MFLLVRYGTSQTRPDQARRQDAVPLTQEERASYSGSRGSGVGIIGYGVPVKPGDAGW